MITLTDKQWEEISETLNLMKDFLKEKELSNHEKTKRRMERIANKLTEGDIRYIVDKFSEGSMTLVQLAAKFGTSRAHISRIYNENVARVLGIKNSVEDLA